MKKRQAIKQPIKWKGRNNVGNHKKTQKSKSTKVVRNCHRKQETEDNRQGRVTDLSLLSSVLAISRNSPGSSGEKKPLAISSMHCFSSGLFS